MSHGIVVEHKRNGIRYAVSTHNFNPKDHVKVRDLNGDETVLGYKPRPHSKNTNKTSAPSTEVTEDSKSTAQKGN